jgi:riboflavin biosynthesis pyrimidine reductase
VAGVVALRDLASAGVVVAEGGPTVNAALVEGDVLDEVCITLASTVAGGASPRWTGPASESLRPLALARVLEEEGYLFLRYVRSTATSEPTPP